VGKGDGVKVGFSNEIGELSFVFSADELREAQKILEMFGWVGDENVGRIMEMVEGWAQAVEHRQ
jgi:hypothetical protein